MVRFSSLAGHGEAQQTRALLEDLVGVSPFVLAHFHGHFSEVGVELVPGLDLQAEVLAHLSEGDADRGGYIIESGAAAGHGDHGGDLTFPLDQGQSKGWLGRRLRPWGLARQAQGLLTSVASLLELSIEVPSYRTRRRYS